MILVVYEVAYEPTGGICQIYSPAFVWDDVTTIVYYVIHVHVSRKVLNQSCPSVAIIVIHGQNCQILIKVMTSG